MSKRMIVALAVLALASGCGKKVALRPASGQPMPQKAETAAVAPSVEMLLTPSSQALPTRSDELVSRSMRLAPTRFDLPPPG